jgi:hypothetical protein
VKAVAPLRGTQSLVGQLGWVFARPSLTLLEVAWRWAFAVPFLAVASARVRAIFEVVPPDSAGIANINFQNPWLAAVRLADAWAQYRPHIAALIPIFVPASALAWVVVSAIGRSLVLKRMDRSIAFRPIAMMLLQAAWLVVFLAAWWGWHLSIGWVAATHLAPNAEPDLAGYAVWAIFLSLGFFTLWAFVSWIVSIAPMLMLLERRSPISALGQSLRLGGTFTGKLVEVNLVMGIVKLALIVVAMVFSSVLLPFIDEVGASTLHLEWIVVGVFYFVANDYFQVVRLKAFLEFWRTYRGPAKAAGIRL